MLGGLAHQAHARDYFFSSSSGNDRYSGTDPDHPWKDLNQLRHTGLAPGDRVFLKRGDIWRSEIKCTSSGTQSDKIVFSAYGQGPRPQVNASIVITHWKRMSESRYTTAYAGPCAMLLEDGEPIRRATGPSVLDGRWYHDSEKLYYRPASGTPADHRIERTSKGAAFWILHQSDIVIDGIDLYGANTAALLIRSCRNVVVKNCRLSASGKGVSIGLKTDGLCVNEDIVISGNEISGNADGIYLVSPANGPYPVARRITVSQNRITDTNYDLVWDHYSKDGHAIGIQNTCDSLFIGNTINHNYNGICLWTHRQARSDRNRFIGNHIHDNQRYGIAHGGEGRNNITGNVYCANLITGNGSLDGPDGGLRINRQNEPANYFINNTLCCNDINILLFSLTDYTRIFNNISYAPAHYHVLIAEKVRGNMIARNLYYPDGPFFGIAHRIYNFRTWKSASGKDADSLVADPRFAGNDRHGPVDFILCATSPAIGTGKKLPHFSPTMDFFQTPFAPAVDLGAFQHSPGPLPAFNLKIID